MNQRKLDEISGYPCLAVLILLFVLLSLPACSTTPDQPQPNPTPIVAEDKTVVISPATMSACAPLPTLANRAYSESEVTTFLVNWANLYTLCAHHHEDLRRLAGQAFRIPGIPAPDAK